MSYKITIEKKPKSTIEISGELTADFFSSFHEKALKELGKDYEIDGFRKGTVPTSLLEQKLPEMYVLEEMANMAIGQIYPKILDEHKIQAIGNPAIQIKKIAKGNPLEFSILCATLPEIKLPDYKKIAKGVPDEEVEEVTEKEIQDTIEQILTMRSQQETSNDSDASKKVLKPELTNEFVKTLGEFEDVLDFKKKLKENLTLEKTARSKNKKRQLILDSIVEKTEIDVPDMLIEYELDRFMEMMKADVSKMGLSYEEYLKHLTKTEKEMREEYRKETEKKIKTEFALKEIGKEEKINPDKDRVKQELETLMQMYPAADKQNAELYVEDLLQKDAVILFLENQR